MKKILLAVFVVAGVLIIGSHAFAWFGHGPMGPGGFGGNGGCAAGRGGEQQQLRYEQHFERMSVILDLNDDQQQQLQSLHEQRRSQQQQWQEQMQASREALRTAAHADPFSEEALRAATRQHADLKADMMVEMAKTREQMASVLTPEQRAKAEQLRAIQGKPCGQQDDNARCGRQGQSKGPRNCQNDCFSR